MQISTLTVFFLLFITFNISFCYLLTTFVCCEKSVFLPFLLISVLYLCFIKFYNSVAVLFFGFGFFFCIYSFGIHKAFWIYGWISFHEFWKVLHHFLFKLYFCPLSLFFFWRIPIKWTFILIFIKTQISDFLFLFFPPKFIFFYVSVGFYLSICFHSHWFFPLLSSLCY